MKKYTVDELSEGKATLLLREDESVVKVVEQSKLPAEVKEGDIINLSFTHAGEVEKVEILQEETEAARKRAETLLQKILNKNK